VALKLPCEVEKIVDHGDRVYTVLLRPARPVPPFRAGQFLHLALDAYDPSRFWPESRVFSIASSPTERECIRILYSVRGRFTARMETDLTTGRKVWIKMPFGDFVIDKEKDVALFAGGTGISAFTAFLEALTPETSQSIVLAYGARSNRLLVCKDLVDRCAKKTAALQPYFFVENAPAREGRTGWPDIGQISVAAMWTRLEHLRNAAYYISGPPAMLKRIGDDLRVRGVSSEAIHIDAWE
jgi:ferredoxin-NADP reductase